ncbi:EamA family transporter [Agromyces salentinus]|uniref:Drug/metabolite exporter YedA n=1 Tax=Agromyces salentinus TaxID=269421 RepID=A0ABN2MFA4_9MICO|nr:EamA family transporter [Agromyces salentinus]
MASKFGLSDRVRLVAALAVVYLVWGSTYVAIKVAIAAIPPLLMSGVRFLIAGALLYAWCALQRRRHPQRGWTPPTPRQWRSGIIIGLLLPAAGTGVVSWAEQYISSGLAALLLATIPIWIVVGAAVFDRERITTPVVIGLATGVAGVVVLVDPFDGAVPALIPMLATLAGALSWGLGSIYSRHATQPAQPLLGSAIQMIAAGLVLVLIGSVSGELSRVDLAEITASSWIAVAYLIVFGSLLAYSAYTWLLAHASSRLVGTYAFVNPLVAVALGWAILGETLTAQTVVAAALVITAVAILVLQPPPSRRPA